MKNIKNQNGAVVAEYAGIIKWPCFQEGDEKILRSVRKKLRKGVYHVWKIAGSVALDSSTVAFAKFEK